MWHPILMINGFIVLVLGIMMMIPSIVMHHYTGALDYNFIQCGLVAIFLGGCLFFSNYVKIQKISILQGYLITICSWFLSPIICALPFYCNGSIDSWHDAIFEATAGITTTGATILTDVESQPVSILTWRAMLNCLGGVGIIIFAVALSPFLGTGGMHLFTKENSDTEEKFLPKIRYIANDIILAYIILNIICALLLKYLGMGWFDALAWASSTLSTGGFSIKNDSISFYNSPIIELVICIFMLLGALPITYFILIAKNKNFHSIVSNSQVNTFIKSVILYTFVLAVVYSFHNDTNFISSLRIVGFNLVAAITTTGIFSSSFVDWGQWAIIGFFIIYFHGGCTGSTSGSVKMFRWQVITAFLKKHINNALSPNQIVVMKAGDKIINDNIVSSVFALVIAFVFATLFFTLIISLTGVDFMTALGAVVGNITGVGCGFTKNIGPNSNFSLFTPFVKCVLSFVMVLGRLEVITVLVLFGKIKLK